jgi:hypothetical protein
MSKIDVLRPAMAEGALCASGESLQFARILHDAGCLQDADVPPSCADVEKVSSVSGVVKTVVRNSLPYVTGDSLPRLKPKLTLIDGPKNA